MDASLPAAPRTAVSVHEGILTPAGEAPPGESLWALRLPQEEGKGVGLGVGAPLGERSPGPGKDEAAPLLWSPAHSPPHACSWGGFQRAQGAARPPTPQGAVTHPTSGLSLGCAHPLLRALDSRVNLGVHVRVQCVGASPLDVRALPPERRIPAPCILPELRWCYSSAWPLGLCPF